MFYTNNKFFNLIKLLFPLKYRFAFHSVPICQVPIEYRNVQYRVPKCRIYSVPRCPGTELSGYRYETSLNHHILLKSLQSHESERPCTRCIHNDSFPIKSAFLSPFRIRKRFHFYFWFIFTTVGGYVLSIYLLIAIFSDWKHRWRNTIYIQEIEIRSYVISLGDDDFIFSAQKIFVTYLRNTKKENFKNVMFLE